MVKKAILLLPVVFALLLFGPGTKCFADAAAQLAQAEECVEQQKFEEAEAIYKQVAAEPGVTDEGLAAQEGLARLYIAWEKQAEADAAYQELLNKYFGHPGIAKAVDHVADAYREAGSYGKARDLYKYVVGNWPEAEHAADSQKGVVLANVLLGDDPNAEAAIQELLSKFAEHEKIAKVVDHLADDYREWGNYEKARSLYAYVVTHWPEAECAVQAQGGVVRTSILLGDDPNAEAGLSKLLEDFSESYEIAKAVDQVADEYRKQTKYDKARELYGHLVARWSDSQQAIDAQRAVVLCSVALDDEPNAEAGLQKLTTDFAGDSRLPEVLYEIGRSYDRAQRYGEAKDVYEHIISQHPRSSVVGGAKLNKAKIEIYSLVAAGDDSSVLAATDKLIEDFNEQPYLDEAIFLIGQQYYDRGTCYESDPTASQIAEQEACNRKAVTVWQRIIEQLSPSPMTAYAYFFTAECYRRVGEHEEAVQYYEKTVDEWPDYGRLWKAQYKIGRCYVKLKRSGLIEKSEADALIAAAYRQVVAEDPTSKEAEWAKRWLNSNTR